MKAMNSEFKKVVTRVKAAQSQLQVMLKDAAWVEDARKYAERQGKEVKKLIKGDVSKMKTFLERERKELNKFQKQIPSEVKKLRKFVTIQKKEFEKLLAGMRNMKFAAPKKVKSGAKKATKKASSKKKTASAK